MRDSPCSGAALGADASMVVLGKIASVYGVRGWVKIISDTSPRDNILNYPCWYLGGVGDWQARRLVDGRLHGKAIVALLQGCTDRDQAQALIGRGIAVPRDQLPELSEDEYYWSDLEGMQVRTVDGVDLGRVQRLFETGANDVMVVRGERERLVPYIWEQVVQRVDLQAGVIVVDWDPDF